MNEIKDIVFKHRWLRVTQYFDRMAWMPCNRLIQLSSIDYISTTGTGNPKGLVDFKVDSQGVSYRILEGVEGGVAKAAESELVDAIDAACGHLEPR